MADATTTKLLDFSVPFDTPLLEQTVAAFYTGPPEQRTVAESALKAFQEHPQSWTRVDAILEQAKSEQTKFYALQILESVIKFKWGALPQEQREGIKTYLSNLIIAACADDAVFRRQATFLKKLDVALVQVLKHDWPARWPSFVPDLVAASKTSEPLCENSMHILRLLSEEVFDFSRGELTQAKTRELKNSLNQQFTLIHDLCLFVLANTRRQELVRATLSALAAYLSWVPAGYIFEGSVVQHLLALFPQAAFRNPALQCLTEVAGLSLGPEADGPFVSLYGAFMTQLAQILPPGTDIASAYERGTDEQQAFVQNLALFLTAFLRAHLRALEAAPSAEVRQALLAGLELLVSVSYVDDTEVFKTCLEYWNYFVPDVYASVSIAGGGAGGAGGGAGAGLGAGGPGGAAFAFAASANGNGNDPASTSALAPPTGAARRQLYSGVLSKLRALMIARMAKPEEVIVVEDESGAIVRETMKDNDVLAQYRSMRETLIYLAHLDHDDTEAQMLERLRGQLAGGPGAWTWQGLNTLCWAIGSVSGSMAEDQENRFLVTVIRDLLNLCEVTRGKDNKAVIASNIMYVVGQYPKFLRAHWKFLKTVVNKLFEFMHETHPGVQDMACDTFLKICSKCKRKFVVLQVGEAQPFVAELLDGLGPTIQDLQPHQVHSFYESVGLMIGAETDAARREDYLARLMAPANATWAELLSRAQADPESLRRPEAVRAAANVLQTNASACASLGHAFLPQMTGMLDPMLRLYQAYSEAVCRSIAEGGPHAARSSAVRHLRGVKKAVLRLVETFVERCEDERLLADRVVPALLDPVLGDYARSLPDARDAEALSCFTAVVAKLGAAVSPHVPRILEAVFEPTLGMITLNFEDYPEHRLRFFALLASVTNHCFPSLLAMSAPQLKLLMDSIVWALRHTERNVAETGLQLLLDLCASFSESPYATAFFTAYYATLVREVMAVMTDAFHKPGFKLHARILHLLFAVVRPDAPPPADPHCTAALAPSPQGLQPALGAPLAGGNAVIRAPLWDTASKGAAAYPSNAAYVRDFVTDLLATSFPNLTPQQVQASVAGMLDLREFSAFKHLLRDFLVQSRAFASADNAELFAEEVAAQRAEQEARMAAIPGMLPPSVAVGDDMGG